MYLFIKEISSYLYLWVPGVYRRPFQPNFVESMSVVPLQNHPLEVEIIQDFTLQKVIPKNQVAGAGWGYRWVSSRHSSAQWRWPHTSQGHRPPVNGQHTSLQVIQVVTFLGWWVKTWPLQRLLVTNPSFWGMKFGHGGWITWSFLVFFVGEFSN